MAQWRGVAKPANVTIAIVGKYNSNLTTLPDISEMNNQTGRGRHGGHGLNGPSGGRTKVPAAIRVDNLYFSSGMAGVLLRVRKDSLALAGGIKEQPHTMKSSGRRSRMS